MMSDDSYTSKIDRGIEKYGCHGLNPRLRQLYEEEDLSLRDLEAVVNEAFASSAIGSGEQAIKFSPQEIVQRVRQLAEVDSTERNRLLNEFEQAGIDAEQLEQDFVTYRTVKNHLNKSLDVDTSRKTESLTITEAIELINDGWTTRLSRVTETTLKRLDNANEISLGSDVSVRVSVMVEDSQSSTEQPFPEFVQSREREHYDRTE